VIGAGQNRRVSTIGDEKRWGCQRWMWDSVPLYISTKNDQFWTYNLVGRRNLIEARLLRHPNLVPRTPNRVTTLFTLVQNDAGSREPCNSASRNTSLL